jgi:single-strand DNA-binding protein
MYNKAFLIGNLTRDPELRYTPAGVPVAHFTVAVNRIKRKGQEKDNVDFIPIVAWRRLAEICGEFLKKGRPVAVEGRLQIRSYTTKAGEKRTASEIIADNVQMLGRKPDGETSPSNKKGSIDSSEIENLLGSEKEETPF